MKRVEATDLDLRTDLAFSDEPTVDTWEERAAIIEFDAGRTRREAEKLAWLGIKNRPDSHKMAPPLNSEEK